jgi:hypothetical protein
MEVVSERSIFVIAQSDSFVRCCTMTAAVIAAFFTVWLPTLFRNVEDTRSPSALP